MNPLTEMWNGHVEAMAKEMAGDVWELCSEDDRKLIIEAAKVIVKLRYAQAGIV